MLKKLHISLIFSNLVVSKQLSSIIVDLRNFVTMFGKALEICKKFAGNQVNEKENVPLCGVVPTFSDLEVVAIKPPTHAILFTILFIKITISLFYTTQNRIIAVITVCR